MAKTGFSKALEKTREILNTRIEDLFVPGRTLENEDLDILEEALVAADVGIEASEEIIERMKIAARSRKIPSGGIIKLLEQEVRVILSQPSETWQPSAEPHIILLVGVNGTGKTTCAGKLAKRIIDSGGKPLLASSDTFRAAANEQLKIWADRAGADIVESVSGADPASVAYDAVNKAIHGGYTAVIIDTAGRLHTKVNLMEELKKIARVCGKKLPGAPHDVFLVVDATTGNNGLVQAQIFHEAINLTG